MLPVYDIATSKGQADYQARLLRLRSTASAFSEQAQWSVRYCKMFSGMVMMPW